MVGAKQIARRFPRVAAMSCPGSESQAAQLRVFGRFWGVRYIFGAKLISAHQERFLVELERVLQVQPYRAAQYRSCSKANLLRMVVKRDAKVKKLYNKLRRRPSSKRQSIVPADSDCMTVLDIDRLTGRRQSNFSVRGFLALGVRRNLSNISSHDLQHVTVKRVSRWTVTRAETIAAAALVAINRSRMQQVGEAIALSAMDIARLQDSSFISVSAEARLGLWRPTYDSVLNLKFSIVTYRGDATNAGCWRGNKLHATLAERAAFIGRGLITDQSILQGSQTKYEMVGPGQKPYEVFYGLI